MNSPKLAMVTGASSGIGLEIAKLAAKDGYDLIVAADTPFVEAAPALKELGANVEEIETDLATQQGVDQLLSALAGREVDVLVANAGQGVGGPFMGQSPQQWMHVIDTNITGTLLLLQPIVRRMVARGEGKVLITGSIAGHMAGAFNAVYNGTKAFIDNFAVALNEELRDSPVTITCLKPGATETEFFARAGMEDTKIGQAKKDDPADVARTGWEAMQKGEASVIHGFKNKMQLAAASVMPETAMAKLHRAETEPGSGNDN
jgi:uncharacterized protein